MRHGMQSSGATNSEMGSVLTVIEPGIVVLRRINPAGV